MVLLEDLAKSPTLGIAVGVGLALPLVLPVVARIARPVVGTLWTGSQALGGTLGLAAERTLEALIKGIYQGVLNEATNRITGLMASTREEIADLVAEARHEYETGIGWPSRR